MVFVCLCVCVCVCVCAVSVREFELGFVRAVECVLEREREVGGEWTGRTMGKETVIKGLASTMATEPESTKMLDYY